MIWIRLVRAVIGASLIVVAVAVAAIAQQPPQDALKRATLQTGDLPAGYETVMVIAQMEPGECSGWHTHPGLEGSYFLEGEVLIKFAGRSEQPIRVERPTPTILYQQPATTPLSAAAQTAARKLCAGASELLSHGGANLCGAWSIADVDLALMLNRLIMNGDQVPLALVRHAGAQWERPSVQDWVRRERPPL